MSKARLVELLGSQYIPDVYLETSRGHEKWAHLIEDAYRKVSVGTNGIPPAQLQALFSPFQTFCA